jgi:hypothetical protein
MLSDFDLIRSEKAGMSEMKKFLKNNKVNLPRSIGQRRVSCYHPPAKGCINGI